jgi:Undecaprenyl-phosphate glucose phosphotransferase
MSPACDLTGLTRVDPSAHRRTPSRNVRRFCRCQPTLTLASPLIGPQFANSSLVFPLRANGWTVFDAGSLQNEAVGNAVSDTFCELHRRRVLSRPFLSGLVALFDGAAIATASLLFFAAYIDTHGGWAPGTLKPYIGATVLNTCLVLQSFAIAGLYRFDALIRPRSHLVRLAMISIQCVVVLVALGSTFNLLDLYTADRALVALLVTILLVCLGRALALVAIHDLRLTARRILVYGATDHGQRLLRALRQRLEPWDQVVGVFDDSADGLRQVEGYPFLGGSDRMIEVGRKLDVDEVLVAGPWDRRDTDLVVDKLSVLSASVRLGPGPIPPAYPGSELSLHYGLPMLSVMEKPLSGTDAIVKTLFDKAFGVLLVLMLAPFLALIGAAIKLDTSGPVFFVQQRYGFHHQLIGVWKFRTMHFEQQDDHADELTRRNDPRVTRVGAFLRRFSFDELPQLFNVLRGEMSLVGPRPHALHAKAAGKLYEDAVARYAARHKVKPGITGWAQVNGWRGETDTEEKLLKRVEHDLYYIENWSLVFDIKILLLTPLAALSGRNSY